MWPRWLLLVGSLGLLTACAMNLPRVRQATVRVDEALGGQIVGVLSCDRVLGVTARHLADHFDLTGPRAAQADLALVDQKVPHTGLRLSQSPPRAGDRVWVVHSPTGMDRAVSEGIVMDDTLTQEGTFPVQVFAWTGSSGGAVVNQRSELLGIVMGVQYFFSSISPLPQVVPITWVIGAQAIQELVHQHSPACGEEHPGELVGAS